MSEERWEIPPTWAWASIGEIAEIVGGGTPSTGDGSNFAEHGIPWLTPADLTGYEKVYISRGRRDLSEKGYRASAARIMPAGTVLFSSRAPIGYCAIADGEISTNQGFKSFVLKSGLSPEYLRHYLLGSVDYAEGKASGTTFKELSGSRAAELSVPVAPIPEQTRIVRKIESLQGKSRRARDHLDHIPRLVEKYKQAVLAAAFAGDLTREWRETRKAGGAWNLVSLDELVDEGPTNGWSPKSGPDATGALTLKLTATTSGMMRLDADAVKRIFDSPAHTSSYWLRPGDLLVQRANSLEYVGASAIFDGPPNTYIYPDLMMRLRIYDHDRRRFVWRFLNSPKAREYFQRHATGTAGNMPKISGATLRALIVPVPTLDAEYAEVVRRIETAFAWVERLASEATSARRLINRLDQSILAEAFRGKLVPQAPTDEPASVLLERIGAERGTAPKARRGRGRPRLSS